MAICEQNNLKALQEKDAPLVSVVIPVYNNELYLSDALDSLVRQTYKKLEIILVDDASPGNVEPIFEKYKSKCPEYIWKLIKKEKTEEYSMHGQQDLQQLRAILLLLSTAMTPYLAIFTINS